MPIRREEVIPGAFVTVMNTAPTGDTAHFNMNGHLVLSNESVPLALGERLRVTTRPRKIQGINLVRVQRQGPFTTTTTTAAHTIEGEVYYCDIVRRCVLTDSFGNNLQGTIPSTTKAVPVVRPTAWTRLLQEDDD